MTLTKNKLTSITIATILILSATTLVTPAFAHPTSETLYFTTFAGGQNVHQVDVSYDGVVTFTQPAPVNIASTSTSGVGGGGADGLSGNPQDSDSLLVGGQGAFIHNVKISDGSVVTTASPATVFHLEVPDPNTVFGTSIPGGAIAVHPIDGSGTVGAGVSVPKAGGSVDITQVISTPANGLFYTSGISTGNGAFGSLTIGATYTTTQLVALLAAAHGGTFDPFTGDIILFGDDHITQVDFTGFVVSDLLVPGADFDQGTVDGNGHAYVASNDGDLIFLDYSGSGLVGDVGNFLNVQFLKASLDDIGPLVGEGSTIVFEKTLKDEGDCFTQSNEVFVKQTSSQSCHFQIEYLGALAVITDVVPAEWDVTRVMDDIDNAQCSFGQKGKSGKAATGIDCGAQTDITIMVWLETRESPDTKRGGSPHDDKDTKFKPTSCDPDFVVNDGAIATSVLTDIDGNPVFVKQSNDLTINAEDLNDLDCDGVPNAEDFCPDSDPINFGPIDPWGCDTRQAGSDD